MNARVRYDDQIQHERSTAPFIPFSSHVADDTIILKSGDLMRSWRLEGISFETADEDDIVSRKEQLNTLLRSISSDHVALCSHTVKRRKSDRLIASFTSEFSREFDERYAESFAEYRMMGTDLYLTLIYRPTPSGAARLFRKAGRRNPVEIRADRQAAIGRLDQLAQQVEVSMRPYQPAVLTTFNSDAGALCSEPLALLNYLISGAWQDVRVPRGPLDQYLGNAWVHMGAETIEIRAANRTRYAQAIDFKDYADHTEAGILNGLLYVDFELTMTQSFSFHDKRKGLDILSRQQTRLMNVEDGSATQIAEISDTIDDLTAGQISMGEYHYSLMIYGDSIEEVRANTNEAMTILQDQGFLASLVSTATDAAWYAQLPGNWSYRPRIAQLTTRNFAGLSCFHNFASGKRDGNPWGQAVTMFKTASGQPMYFNFHYATSDDDISDRMVLANTLLTGQSGVGKTVFMNALLLQSDKYRTEDPEGFAAVFFDHKEGAKLCIKALGGRYQTIKNGQPTGFNPFQQEPTEGNLLFLERLVGVLADGTLTTAEELRVSDAVRTVMAMPREHRRLTTLLQNIPDGAETEDARDNSLAKRLSKWCHDDGDGRSGSLAWALDCDTDVVDFTGCAYHGFDGTDFLDNPDVRGPIAMYLLHRMKSVIDGRRFMYWMDEFWKWVDDPALSEFVGEEQVGIRKMNGFGVFSTQMPKSVLKSRIAAELVEQVATEVYLPNPKAERTDYVDGFKLTAAEFKIVRALPEESRMFLVKQGRRSMIGRLDLEGFDDDLAILSGNATNNALFDQIVADVGDDPAVWIPEFHRQRQR